jgi:ATP adenylyltransferase
MRWIFSMARRAVPSKKSAKPKSRWPTERPVLFRPERLKYVRKMIKPDGCVFCAAIKKGVGAESLLLYKGEHAIIVLNKFPYNTGHILVLPRRHTGEFTDATDEEHLEMNQCLRKLVKVLTEVYQPAGFNIGLNLGSASGAGIPEHLHYHVIPRWNGDTNFFPLIAQTKVVVETLEQTFDRLIPFFK